MMVKRWLTGLRFGGMPFNTTFTLKEKNISIKNKVDRKQA